MLDVTATGASALAAATATRLFEGLDENLDGNNESDLGRIGPVQRRADS